MKCAIMQPHYLPWPGYFNLMSKVNKFIFLDDVQFSKSSWQSRNQIIINNSKKWITIPTRKSILKTSICKKLIDNSKNWKVLQLRTISQTYASHYFFKDLEELILFIKKTDKLYLSEFNIEIIKFLSFKLNIKVEFANTTDLDVNEYRTFKLVGILNKVCAKEYISPLGAQDYLEKDGFSKITKVKLTINDYKQQQYEQLNQLCFIPNLSIVDLIANIGWKNTEAYIKNN
jgi:hypothetical protein